MASIRQLKEKKTSVKTIHKITLSMENISISKSRRAAKSLSLYQDYIHEFESIYEALISNSKTPSEKLDKNLWIVFSSDLGLAGSFNILLIKTLFENFNPQKDEVIVFGSRGAAILSSKIPQDRLKTFTLDQLNNNDFFVDVVSNILSKHLDEDMNVKAIYTEYINQITFKPKLQQILPFEKKKAYDNKQTTIAKKSESNIEYEFEPSATSIVNSTLDIFLFSQLNYFYKNSLASEHTSRRVAMENATNNGEEMLRTLNIEYNRKRQANITQEILEIINGAEGVR